MTACLHCGQTIDPNTGLDERGRKTCDEFAADHDMQNEEHDWDLEGEPCGHKRTWWR